MWKQVVHRRVQTEILFANLSGWHKYGNLWIIDKHEFDRNTDQNLRTQYFLYSLKQTMLLPLAIHSIQNLPHQLLKKKL